MKVFFTNLGCKLNQAELEHLARQFHAAGHHIVHELSEAQLHIVNSCAVTHLAARDSRKTARRGRRRNPEVLTVLTGCYVDSDPQQAADLEGVDLVVANSDKNSILERVQDAFPDFEPRPEPAADLPVPCAPIDFGNRRALVKIEDGCDMSCSFCIIPTTRGGQRSRPFETVLKEVADLSRSGFREVVLTGVQISSYRWQTMRLYDLLETLLGAVEQSRLRLTSMAPWRFDPELLELFARPRLCRHLHLSLQSGCTRTLRRMRRPYSASRFEALVDEIRSKIPGVAITTDVIVGFPGETDRDFEESLRFVERVGFARVHAFPFSPRPGTEAASLPDQVPHASRRRRMERMLEIARLSSERFQNRFLGHRLEVLWESRRNGIWQGTTDNYIRVLKRSPEALGGELRQERLQRVTERGVFCQASSRGPRRPARQAHPRASERATMISP